MFCTKCGAQIEGNTAFCIFCGAPVWTIPVLKDAGEYEATSVLPEYPASFDETSVLAEGDSLADSEAGTSVVEAPTTFLGQGADDSSTVILSNGAQGGELAGVVFSLSRENGDWCALSSFPTVVGKGSEADLCIGDNPAVSRLHVRLLRDGDVFAAEDLGSSNGTFIGDYRLPVGVPTIVEDGDLLKLGDEVLSVSISK